MSYHDRSHRRRLAPRTQPPRYGVGYGVTRQVGQVARCGRDESRLRRHRTSVIADRRSSVSSQSGPPNRRKISGAAAAPLQCESQRNTAGGAGAAAGTVRSGRRGYIISTLVCLRSVSLRRAATRVTRCDAMPRGDRRAHAKPARSPQARGARRGSALLRAGSAGRRRDPARGTGPGGPARCGRRDRGRPFARLRYRGGTGRSDPRRGPTRHDRPCGGRRRARARAPAPRPAGGPAPTRDRAPRPGARARPAPACDVPRADGARRARFECPSTCPISFRPGRTGNETLSLCAVR